MTWSTAAGLRDLAGEKTTSTSTWRQIQLGYTSTWLHQLDIHLSALILNLETRQLRYMPTWETESHLIRNPFDTTTTGYGWVQP